MVNPVANASIADTLEARLADARKRHEDGEYGSIPWAIAELGIQAQWATVYPSCLSGASAAVDGGCRQLACRRRSPPRSGGGLSATTHVTAGGIAPAYGYFKFSPDWITVAPLQGRWDLITWRGSIEPQLEVAELKVFADGTVPTPPVDDVELCGEFRATHLLTFMVILRCCLPVVQLALRSCRERLDAGQQAWHFIQSTYQVKDDLYIGQLEEKMTHIRMGKKESATDYRNRARRILAEMRMAGAEYSMVSYITHVLKGLPRSYNLMKRMSMVPSTHIEEDVVDEGRRQLQRQEPRRRGGIVLDGRRGGANGLAGAGGWQGLTGGGGSCAGKPDDGAARQRLLPPPDGDEGGLRRLGAERRCEARKPAIWWPAEGKRSAVAGRRQRDAARHCDRGGARSSMLQRTSPLHRPSPLLDAIVVDRVGGSTGDCLGVKVDP
ncbi:unnamed protein product [Closterium sp. NIES-54]